jgi:hypothetical protein
MVSTPHYTDPEAQPPGMRFYSIIGERMDRAWAEAEELKRNGLDHVEAHLIIQWRSMTREAQRELLAAWRKIK